MNFLTRILSLLYRVYDVLFGTRWYIIEGNIGCGKTTLIRKLKEDNHLEVIEEPVEMWKTMVDESGQNILGLFYTNPKRYAYLFQTVVFKTRMMALEHPQEKLIRFSERSIWTDKHIFSKSCHELGHLNQLEKNTYDIWFKWLEDKITRKPDGIIYLYAAPETCLSRVQERDRSEEGGISIDYLKTIHTKHEEWLGNNTEYEGIPIHIIDNTNDTSFTLGQVQDITNYNSKYYRIRNRVRDTMADWKNRFIIWSTQQLVKAKIL